MSHFALTVIHQDRGVAEFAIEPYCTEAHEYFEREVYMTRADYIEGYKLLHPESTLDDDAIWANRTLEYDDYDDENIYTNYNPNGKYDWCGVGGRYSGLLKVRKSADAYTLHVNENSKDSYEHRYRNVDSARISDVLFNKMNYNKTKARELSKVWDGFTPEHRAIYKDKDEFIHANIAFYTHALYNAETGEWIEEDEFDRIEDYIHQFYSIIFDSHRYWMTIIDCHI